MIDTTKRDFLKAAGAAATTAATAAALGGAGPAAAATTPAAAARGRRWDLVVVGGGNAGLPAAIFAAQRGARVLIVEAAGQVGGTLFYSTGQMSAAGTKLQKARGIVDTPQSHYDDVMTISGGTADPTLLRLAVDNAAPAFDWLTDHGFQVLEGHPVTGTTHDPYSHARYAWGAKGGRSILDVLQARLEPEIARGRIVVLTQTEVTGLLQGKDGAVTGVATRSASGETARYASRHVALTCGGFTSNPALYAKLEGAPTYTRATYPYSKGAGVDLALAAGGWVRGGENHTPLFGAVLADAEYPAMIRALVRHFPPERPPWEIYVNQAGRRFVCEDVASHDAYEQGLRAQSDERCWVVFDEAIFQAAPPIVSGGIGAPWTHEDTKEAFASPTPMFYRADTLPALAQAAGIDADGLVDTVKLYNRAQRRGVDALGRRHLPLPIVRPPFHAIQLQSWTLMSYAGIAVDGRLRVTRRDGTPIPNLYAAGELLGMGQLMGRAVCGGMAVMPALALGRLLGHEIIDV